ncbi:MAG: glycosyltransferase family 2 protein [Lachnospiraceae bacterium]|nr:glycosyltransferase family 2 protein [Lachnospiraceae bacterium]
MRGGRLFVVVPCYNEEEVLPETAKRLKEELSKLAAAGTIDDNSRILFVDDGSADRTWELIAGLHAQDPVFQGIRLARNSGHQNALIAGLFTAGSLCDMTISMDADLQDDVHVIGQMVERYHAGADIVYGVRSARRSDTWFKRVTAEGFYRLMNRMGANTVYNHADCRLMSARALAGLRQFGEVNLFLRGMVPLVGFSSDTVTYERAERFAGESKYPISKMLQFAAQGITSLSVRPIRMITGLGFFIFFVSIVVFIYSLVRYFTGHTITGWTTTVLSVWAIGGLMMISLGVIGEYIGKIYLESKGRPRYIIADYQGDATDTPDLIDRKGVI